MFPPCVAGFWHVWSQKKIHTRILSHPRTYIHKHTHIHIHMHAYTNAYTRTQTGKYPYDLEDDVDVSQSNRSQMMLERMEQEKYPLPSR